MNIDVSVIIPAYNRVATLARAINSVLAQSIQPQEIIVVDDGSSDATSEVVKSYDSVSLLRQKNMGVSTARNNGVLMADSKWIAFLDSDDTWEPKKLEKQYRYHEQHPDILISYTDETWIRNNLHVNLPKKFSKSADNLYERSLEQCIIAPSSVMIERKLFNTMGGFNESLEVCEDYDLWLRLLKEHHIALIDEKLINKYGGHDDQLSTKHWGMDRFRIRALEALLLQYPDDMMLLEVMLEKYKLLFEGANKHERHDDAFHYKQRIEVLDKLLLHR